MTARQQIARLLPLVLLVILVAAGLRGEVASPRWNGPLKSDGVPIGLALEVILAVLLVITFRRDAAARRAAERRPYNGEPADVEPSAVLRSALKWLLSAGMVAVAVVLISDLHLHFFRKAGPPRLPPSAKKPPKARQLPPSHGGGWTVHIPWGPILYGLLVVALIAAVVISIWWSARLRKAAAPLVIVDTSTEELREAVESGRAALAEIDDARAAIIACYVAMERSLAERGTQRSVADTPDELLARAVAAGTVRGPAASRLTALFYEARFSSHPVAARPAGRRRRGPRRAGRRAGRGQGGRRRGRRAGSGIGHGGPVQHAGRRRPSVSASPARRATAAGTAPAGSGSRWRDAVPELLIAAIAVVVAALAAAAVSGWAGVVVVAAAATVLALIAARGTIPRSSAQAFRRATEKPQARSISGYGQRRFMVATSVGSRAGYESELRPVLEHILAARLADDHGVNLYTEPEAARRAFCRSRADESLWPWIDPAQALKSDDRQRQRQRHPPPHPGQSDHPIGAVVTPEETARQAAAILDELDKAVVGRRRTLELVLIGILAGGHVLLEDLPGLGKTLIARSFASVLGLDFARIQFTPDLLPSDVVGAPLYDQRNGEMVFRPGPVFTQLLLADEINRTPPKTQAALLEAMGESQVSVDGQSRPLPSPFIVLATDNPIEYEGTYELPEAQLDRFLMRLRLGYLTRVDETDMLRRRVDRAAEAVALVPVTDAAGLLAMRESLERVEISDDLLDYVIAIVTATRKDPQIQVGASPRGGLALVQLARGQALLHQRDYVVPDDIKQVAVPALAHRITLRPELWVRQVSADDVVARLLSAVPTPRTDPTARAGPGGARAGAVAG